MSTNPPRDDRQSHDAHQPHNVYVRRRLLVLGCIVAAIAIVALVIWRPGSSSGPEAKPNTSVAADAGQSASAGPSSSADAPVDVKKCAKKDIVVVAMTDASTYASGALPKLSLSITNNGKKPCSIDVGTSQQVFTITSGAETYWTSTDCQTEPTNAVTQLKAGQTLTSNPAIEWNRTRSSPDSCEGERPAVPAGGASYHLSTSVAGIESEKTKQFILR